MQTATRSMFFVMAAAAGLTFALLDARAQAGGPYDPTHYWTYTIENPNSGFHPIRATDQFLPMTPLQALRSVKLLNWVHKDNSPVPDTLRHFVWWDVMPKIPVSRIVEIENQFGRFVIGVENLDFLLAPAWKNVPQPIDPKWSHYLCYRAQGPTSNNGLRTFRDEWREDQQPVFELRYLCNPCIKEHLGQIYPITDEITHFAVYRMNPFSENFSVPVFDQFQPAQYLVNQYPQEWLFVPSLKREVPTESKSSTWGRLKTLYR